MRRMLDQTFGSFGWPAPAEARGWSPLVDIEEADDAYVIEAELPGVKPENVNIELVGNELAITGKVKEREHKGACGGRRAAQAASPTGLHYRLGSRPTTSRRVCLTASSPFVSRRPSAPNGRRLRSSPNGAEGRHGH
jgi:hypothetical protein